MNIYNAQVSITIVMLMVRSSGLATRDVAFIVSSRFKIKALSLRSCFVPFDPGSRELLGGQLVRTILLNRKLAEERSVVCGVQNSFAFIISQKRDSGCTYVTFKTHLFASLDMPISKNV